MPLDYRQVATFLGHPSNGGLVGMDVLTAIRDPTFPGVAWTEHAYEWPTADLLSWSGMAAPTATALVPTSATIGDPSFTVHVQGTGFTPSSVILWNGLEEPTTVVSPTELTTGVNMPLWTAPAVVPVTVQTGGVHVTDPPLTFEFLPAAPPLTRTGPLPQAPKPARVR